MHLFTVTVLFVITINFNQIMGADDEEHVKQMYAKCREETQLEPGDMEAFKKMELPTTNKGKCMMGCLMREGSILKDGKFNKEGAMKVAERYYAEREDDMQKARQVIDTCEERVANETEECEIASKLAQCVIEEAQKVGLSSVPQA